tara:strand:- start:961 stop:1722 length:762 start_codon:yes stop_codon:yes gene_type:complete
MYLTSPKKSVFHLVSILISTLTTGFSSAMISYDMDTSSHSRKEVPKLYGYIKDDSTSRFLTFGLLMALACFQNLSRTIGTALLFVASKQLAFGVILVEMILYHLHKLMRADYVCWVAGLEGNGRFLVGFVVHTVTKIIVDFTGMVHCRGAKLTGGALFSVMTVYSQCFPFMALVILDAMEVEEEENMMERGKLVIALAILVACWGLCVTGFFSVIKREYLWTFFATETAADFCRNTFLLSKDPFVKLMSAFDK